MKIVSVTDISAEAREAAQRHGLGELEQAFAEIPIKIKLSTLLKGGGVKDVGNRLCLFRNGLIRHSAADGTAPEVFRWDQIETTYQLREIRYHRQRPERHYRYDGTRYQYRFIKPGGVELRVGEGVFHDPTKFNKEKSGNLFNSHDEQQYADAGQIACERVAQVQLPAAMRALEAGGTLSFGKASISMAGVDTGKGMVPWQDLSELQVKNGSVVIKKQGKFFSLFDQPAAAIPNFQVFVVLASAMRRQSI
ncbi:hypothetical protein KGQ19_00425 [Catenulispora sp. NL8]|uniref:Uncharacterized protein n=1 Tax=Catenulispora pinistramenti TaxID=2705254 RepID=A0ABS5KGW5_9ACTN|nr:DUF6585 family protein [Catenulispora pinistramenti]MBS2545323.1 hypothetical protein [Catenulispora pinistramenti]